MQTLRTPELTGGILPRTELIEHGEHREMLARVVDLAERALKTWTVEFSDFLSPPELAEVMERLQPLADIEVLAWGGYAQAERKRLAIARPSVLPQVPLPSSLDFRNDDACAREIVELAALDIRGNFLFDTATHRDFLGAILGTGIVREKVGDILVMGEQGAQVLVVPELVPHLEMSLTHVRSVPVKVTPVALDSLRVRPPRTKFITTVEASLRLDAIASAGFSMSRSRMAGDIQSGDVRVNWKPVTQASRSVNSGDTIVIRGRGRVQVDDVSLTKKGRYRVEMTRYL